MSQHAFHRSGTVLSNEEIVFVCRALISHQLKLLCLRECKLSGKDLHRILKLVGECSSLQQLTLNVGMIKSVKDVESLAHCIKKNKSLTGLHIHGSELGDVGMQILGRALSEHPGIVSLDVGDCQLGDVSIDMMYALMLPTTNRPGLTELTLSDNPRISALGWTQFGMCLANCNSLRWLFLDYNPLGDYGAACILVGIAASQSVEVLDMEACGLTEHTGQSILHLVQNHLGSLSRMKLSNNRIRKSTTEAIKRHISENNLDASETASSLTVDDFFSINSSRGSFSLKSKRKRPSRCPLHKAGEEVGKKRAGVYFINFKF
ncbi:hypothetical protein RRG08_012891 [Elysia crispata]|uniref:Uncharacterized protein n=1 Tax=Elysia crispata TaxID=231223 RepID=A0AAE1E4H5_9GAST|nr:hypothetical protein RRG08_012891 [Elysia crispata]